jgi:hypothetical protein
MGIVLEMVATDKTPATAALRRDIKQPVQLFPTLNAATMGRWSEPTPQFGIVSA